MADCKPNSDAKYGKLRQLTLEELERLLIQGSHLPEEQRDEAFYNAVEHAILEKEHESPTGRLGNIDRSWEEFQTSYFSEEDEGRRLYPDTILPRQNTVKRSKPKVWRRLTAAAAVVALLVTSAFVAQASGLNVFGFAVRWTDSTFSIKRSETVEQIPEGYAYFQCTPELLAAFEERGIEESVIPELCLEGYTIWEVSSVDLVSYSIVDCVLVNSEGNHYTIMIFNYNDSSPIESRGPRFEKDANEVEFYKHNGNPCYIFSNNKCNVGVLLLDHYLISINGFISKAQIRMLIDSIAP